MTSGRQKRDWNKLKIEFFKSDYTNVSDFFRNEYNTKSTRVRKNTTWWRDEKLEFSKRMAEQAKKEYEQEKKDEWKRVYENIDKARKKWLHDLSKKLVQEKEDNPKNMIEILRHFRLEVWETTEKNDITWELKKKYIFSDELWSSQFINQDEWKDGKD